MNRWIYGWILSVLCFIVALVAACDQFSGITEKESDLAHGLVESADTGGQDVVASTTGSARRVILDRNSAEIIIGSFNIQRFGISKMGNAKVMATLVAIARQFDVLAIQEIRSRNDQAFLQKYVNMINADGSRYSYVLSPLLGSKKYTEQYGFVFDTDRIELVSEGAVVPDPNQLLSREPMFSRFRTRTAVPDQAFTFALANIHIAPNESREELATLYEVYLWLQSYLQNVEDDVILLGDFNEPPRHYGQMWQIRTLAAALPEGVKTNTLGTRSYDNILFDQRMTLEYAGKSGVMDIRQIFGLTMEEAQDVSDHLPVWAAFSAGEALHQNQFARQRPGGQDR